MVAKKYSPGFIVEKFISGNMYRASVIGKSKVLICQKEKANVVGDGHSTIKELIERKNSHVDRKNTEQRNATIHKIPINENLIQTLIDRNLTLDSRVPKDKKIYVQEKFVLAHGCDIINCGDIIHPDNKELFLGIAKILKSDLVGIDFICPDISKSYKDQETAVLEANSLPYIDMHQYPTEGKSEPVAKIVWETVFEKLNKEI
jgi:cyanophycin synthetase